MLTDQELWSIRAQCIDHGNGVMMTQFFIHHRNDEKMLKPLQQNTWLQLVIPLGFWTF